MEEDLGLEGIMERLEESTMFHLSLSDKELFHSNMLAWIFEKYPVFFHTLFETGSSDTKLEVEREKNNFDLFITYEEKKEKKYILIENKVKSIPTKKQLEEYKVKNESTKYVERKKPYNTDELNAFDEADDRAKNTRYVLLSLVKPFWFEKYEEEYIWKDWLYLSYQTVAEKFKECVGKLVFDTSNQKEISYHKSLIEDYNKYILGLTNILLMIKNESKYLPMYELGENQALKRFSTQLQRWRAEIHKKELYEKIYDRNRPNSMIENFRLAKNDDIGKFCLGSGFSDMGHNEVLEYKMIIHVSEPFKQTVKRNRKIVEIDVWNVLVFGIQIEGVEFRIVLESSKENCFDTVKECFYENNRTMKTNLWFDLIDVSSLDQSNIIPEKLQGRNKKDNIHNLEKDEIKKYGKSFIYKYFTLDEKVEKVAVYEAIYSIHTKLIEVLKDRESNSKFNEFKAYLDKEWVDKQTV